MELLQCRDRCLKKFSVGESFVPDGNAYIVQQIESNVWYRGIRETRRWNNIWYCATSLYEK